LNKGDVVAMENGMWTMVLKWHDKKHHTSQPLRFNWNSHNHLMQWNINQTTSCRWLQFWQIFSWSLRSNV
jgi:hypothetical protein